MRHPVIDVAATGRNLKILYAKKGYTASDIKKQLGIGSSQAVYKWFAGSSLPSIDNLLILAILLEVSVEDILIINEVEDVNQSK